MWYLCWSSMWIRNAAEIVTGCDLAVTCCDDQVKQHVKTSLDLETESFDLSLWKKLTWTMNAIRKRFGRITRTQRGDVLKFRLHHLERRR